MFTSVSVFCPKIVYNFPSFQAVSMKLCIHVLKKCMMFLKIKIIFDKVTAFSTKN